jgi:exoribonuclease II
MKTKTKPQVKITFDFQPENQILIIYKNHVKQIIFQGATRDLYELMKSVLQEDRDFQSYLSFFGLADDHLMNWFIDYLRHNEGREVFNMFKRAAIG